MNGCPAPCLWTSSTPVHLRDKIDKGIDHVVMLRIFPGKGKLAVHKRIVNQILPDVRQGYFIKLILIGDDNTVFFWGQQEGTSGLKILDEPTASLSAKETDQLFTVIRELKNQDVGIIYISHRPDEVKRIGDRVLSINKQPGIIVKGTWQPALMSGILNKNTVNILWNGCAASSKIWVIPKRSWKDDYLFLLNNGK